MKKQKHRLLIFGVLITIATGAMYLLNRFIEASSILKEKLSAKDGYYYNWRFGDIYYEKKGSGAPLLLIHDLTPYSSSFEWNRITNALAENYTVYSIDLLGCGRSDKPKITYTNFLYVQLLNDFIQEIIEEKTCVIASGYSSSLAIMACNYNNDAFQKIMLINPVELGVLNQNPTKKSKLAKFILEIPILGTMVYYLLTARSNVDLMLTENYLYNPFHVDGNIIDTYYEAAHLGNGNGKYLLSSLTGRYMNLNIIHGLKALNNSIMILGGKQQPNIVNTIDSYETFNPAIESALIPKSKKLPHYEAAEQVLKQIRIFF